MFGGYRLFFFEKIRSQLLLYELVTTFCRSPRVKELPPDLGALVSVFSVEPVSVLLSELDEPEDEESLFLFFFAMLKSLCFVCASAFN